MNRFFIGLYLFISLLFHTSQMCAQSSEQTSVKVISLDSLSAADEELLIQYQDSFKNDFYTLMDVFNTAKQVLPDTTVNNMDKSSHMEICFDFISRIFVNGRIVQLTTTKGKVIGLNGAGFYPSITYYHKTGFYVNLNTSFYTDKLIAGATPVPVVSPQLGYVHSFFNRWFLSASYTRMLTTYGSSESKNLLNNTLAVTSTVDIWKRLIFTSALNFYWSGDHSSALPADERTSVEILLSLRKEFKLHNFLGAREFTITPALNFYFANDNRTYITALAVSDVKKDARKDSIARAQNIDDFFGFLDLEPSLSLDWRIRNLDINFTPVLAIPVNVFYPGKDVRTLNPRLYRFYAQAGIKYLFCVKRKAKKIQ